MSDKSADQLRAAQIQRAKTIAQRLAGPDVKPTHHVLLRGEGERPRGDSGRMDVPDDDEQDIPDLWPNRKAAGR